MSYGSERTMDGSYTALLTGLIFAAALLYSSVGHAGASGYLAAMALFSVPPDTMRPVALVLNILVATIATVRFTRAGLFSARLLWPFAVSSVPTAFIGGSLHLRGHWFQWLVALTLAVGGVRLLAPVPSTAHAPTTPPVALALCGGAVIGLLSGLTGTGGGIYLSPLLLFAGWAETRETGGVSAAFILVNSLAGLAGNLASVGSLPVEVVWWAPAAVVGGFIGSELGARRVATETFRQLLAVVLLVAALKLAVT
jgi:uncharacterized membrane protein YfcA